MKKILGTALAAGAAMAATTGAANAEATWSFNVGAATDYVFRGIDQTPAVVDDETNGQVFGGADVTVGSFYAGTWLSNMGYADDQGLEYDLYVGWKPQLGGATLDLSAIYYGYKDGDIVDYSEGNTIELKAGISGDVGGATLGAAVYWSPDYAGDADFLDDDDSFYIEANAAYTFSNNVTLSGAVGQVTVDDLPVDSYVTANAGLTVPITDTFSIDVRYIASDDDAWAFGEADDSAVATLKATF